MFRIFVLGVAGAALEEGQRDLLGRCRAIVVSEKYRHLVAGMGATVLPIAPVAGALAAIEEALTGSDVGVVASGDPLFFGIGRTLLARFGPERVEVLPGLSALQLACARFKLPWDDARVVSLHGRRDEHLPGRLLAGGKTMILTDHRLSPDRIAATLVDYLESVGAGAVLAGSRLLVAENLGSDDERLVAGSLAEMARRTFAPLNVTILLRPVSAASRGQFGLRETELAHSRGLITKDEVRAVTLHKLALPAEGVFWDIGAGSGSISVEAGRLCPGLQIHAVDKEEEQLANLRANIVAFETFGVVPVAGAAPEVLARLPAPDRVFVGGSGGMLEEILDAVAPRLKAGGRLVVNGVTAATRTQAPELLARHGLGVDLSEVRVGRAVYPGDRQELNPITIMTGRK